MKNSILNEINRVREIMGVINEQKVKTVVGQEIVEINLLCYQFLLVV